MSPGLEQFFPASYDRTTKMLSAVICAVMAGIAVGTGSMIAVIVGVLAIGLSYAWSPRGYTIAGQSILVKRLIGNAWISLERASEVRAATPDDFRGCLRLFGVGGVFGYYGLFRTSKLGKSSWYLTNRSNAVVIVTPDKTALVSPDDREGFLQAVRAAAPVGSLPLDSYGSYGNTTSVRFGSVIGIAIGLIALAVVLMAILYSPGPPSYTLTSDSLTIHDRFYPVTLHAADVDVAQIRVVDLNADKQWEPTARTNGFANRHYWSGWFRLPGGRRVRLYSAGSRRLVLLPPKGAAPPVLLESKDPDEFAAELRREWSAS